MFYLNRRYNRRYSRRYNRPIVPPIHIKHVHSSLSYKQATFHKYDRRGNESPSGYGPLWLVDGNTLHMRLTWMGTLMPFDYEHCDPFRL